MNVPPLTSTVHAADLPLEKLAGNSNVSEQEKIAEVSRQFEAVLLRQILASAQKTHFASKLSDNSTTRGIYRDMVTAQLADGISKSGALGLAKTLSQQMKKELNGAQNVAGPNPLTALDRSATVAKSSRSAEITHKGGAANLMLPPKATSAQTQEKAALKRSHSKRFAMIETLDPARQRLECERFSAAFPRTSTAKRVVPTQTTGLTTKAHD